MLDCIYQLNNSEAIEFISSNFELYLKRKQRNLLSLPRKRKVCFHDLFHFLSFSVIYGTCEIFGTLPGESQEIEVVDKMAATKVLPEFTVPLPALFFF